MPATVYDAVIGAVTLKQVMRTAFAGGGTVIAGQASGAVDPSAYFGGTADPRCVFESADVAGVITGISVSTGLHVSSGTLTIPFNARVNGGTFAGSLAHNTLSGANGLAVPRSFSAGQDDEAALAEIELWFRSTDGLTNPVTVNGSQTLAAQSFNAQYALGPCSVNGTVVDGIQRATVNPGITVQARRANGGIYPVSLYIVQRRPSIDLVFDDISALEDFTSDYKAMTAAIVYFRKRAEGGTFVADATEEHCKFSFADGITSTEDVSGSGNENGTATLRLFGEALTASAAAAIA